MHFMRIRPIAILLTLSTFTFSPLYTQNLSTQQVIAWEEDINFVLARLWQTFPDADQRLDKASLQAAAEQLKADLPSLNQNEVIIRLQGILALTKEGSNGIYPFQEKLNYQMLPLKAYWFTDGLFVCDAAVPYEHLIGERIVRVNNVPIEEIWEKLKRLLSGDNEHQQRGAATYTWQMAPWLAYLTETDDLSNAVLTLSTGQEEAVAFRPNTAYLALDRKLPSYRALSSGSGAHANENYWMEYIEEERTLFLQFLAIRDSDSGPNFKQFVEEVESMLQGGSVDRLIIDNRYGGGGNGFKLKPFTDLVRENERINQFGSLFVLIGRGTRGTVQELTSILELNTRAILVGQPTGEGPNSVGDIKAVTLPNSGIDVWLVHTFWPTSWPMDPRISIAPHLAVDYSWSSFAAQEDPWLTAALDHAVQSISAGNVGWQPKAGKYSNGKYTVMLAQKDGRWYLEMKRKMKSFFEIHTELYPAGDGQYRSDIVDVYLEAGTVGDGSLRLNWKGIAIDLVP